MIHISRRNLGSYRIPDDCPGKVCVDIGANVGDFTAFAQNRFNTIHFYEPYAPAFAIASEQLAHAPHVVGFREAAYSEDGARVELIGHQNRDSGSNAVRSTLLNEHWDLPLDGTVPTVSLPTILARCGGRVDYLKCDCETSEYHVFMGQDLTGVGYIGLEIHWQMGRERYDALLMHLGRTHDVRAVPAWTYDRNYEVLLSPHFRPRP